MAVTFAVGAVTGTVLTFEFGLLWPHFMGTWGPAFGVPFAFEGLFFFTEAIFVAIYIYGWKRLEAVGALLDRRADRDRRHRRKRVRRRRQRVDERAVGLHAELVPARSSTSIRSRSSSTRRCRTRRRTWSSRRTSSVASSSRPSTPWPCSAVGRDRYYRLGFIIPFTVAAIAAPVQMAVGDTLARWVYNNQPAKFAAIELVPTTGERRPGDAVRTRERQRHRDRRDPDTRARVDPVGSEDGHEHRGRRPQRVSQRTINRRSREVERRPPGVGHHGRARHAVHAVGGLVRRLLAVQTRHPRRRSWFLRIAAVYRRPRRGLRWRPVGS